jgi:hypothetical protein
MCGSEKEEIPAFAQSDFEISWRERLEKVVAERGLALRKKVE